MVLCCTVFAFMGAFPCNIDSCLVLEAELWGMLNGLSLTWAVLESDSFFANSLISSYISDMQPNSQIVLEVRHLLNQSWDIVVQHTLT